MISLILNWGNTSKRFLKKARHRVIEAIFLPHDRTA
jgi:hypothetical protein